MTQPRGSTLAIVIAVAIGFRLAPYLLHSFGLQIDPNDTLYPWNFSPILPLCVFGAACYASRWAALYPEPSRVALRRSAPAPVGGLA